MNHFVHRTIVKAPLEKINSFHHSRHAFEELSPPIMFVRLIQAEPIANGAILHFRIVMRNEKTLYPRTPLPERLDLIIRMFLNLVLRIRNELVPSSIGIIAIPSVR